MATAEEPIVSRLKRRLKDDLVANGPNLNDAEQPESEVSHDNSKFRDRITDRYAAYQLGV